MEHDGGTIKRELPDVDSRRIVGQFMANVNHHTILYCTDSDPEENQTEQTTIFSHWMKWIIPSIRVQMLWSLSIPIILVEWSHFLLHVVLLLFINKFFVSLFTIGSPRSDTPRRAAMDQKTLFVLHSLFLGLQKRDRPSDKCIGCHIGEIECMEEGNGERRYCSEMCQNVFHSLFLPMGQKRAREVVVERPDFRQMMELVDDPVIAQIIVYTYPYYRERPAHMRAILDLRGESKQLKELIDQYILKEVRELSPEISDILDNDSLLLFPNLRVFHILGEASEINFVGSLTQLEELEIWGDKIGDDSLFNLEKLSKLVILNDTEISSHSLSWLTNLRFLFVAINGHFSDNDLSQLPPSLSSLSLSDCPLLSNTGILSLSRLSNLTSLELETIHVNDQGLGRLPGLKNLIITKNENFIGNNASLGNMRLLETLITTECPNFEGGGLRYKSPLKMLAARNTKITDSALSGEINLTTLDISGTEVTDNRLIELVHLKHLAIQNSPNLTGECFLKLTGLKFLDLSGSPLVTRSTLLGLTNLETLFLDYTSMQPAKNEPPLKLPKLTILSLRRTRALRSGDMVHFTNLTELSLAENEVIQGKVYLRNLSSLLNLNLSYNKVIENDDLTIFTRLEKITLTGNTVIKSDALRNMPNLKEIVLRDGSLTDDITFVDYV